MENPSENPLLPDAPIVALLSLDGNPLLKDMPLDKIKELLARVKTLAQQPVSLSAAVAKEAGGKRGTASAARKAKLDLL